MSSVEIRVLGDFDFIEQIIHGVARVYNQDGVFNTASGILLMLLLLWASIGHIMNPDKAPFPFREFLMGLIGWIVFASPMSPKYDVELTSIRDAHRFTVINDVPFIAAVPSAIASNFFSGIREIMEVSFAPVTFSSSDKEADPLSALVKMYDQRPPTSMQFKSNNKGYDLGKTITEYVQNCYVVDHELTGRDPTMSIELLRTTTISQSLFQALKVTYDFLQTDVYLTAGGSHFGTQMACPDAHSAIMSALNNTTLENNLTDFYEKKGVSREALRNASAMIYGSYGIGPSPYDIQLGMFQSYMIRDGLKNTSLENYTDQMVFQGMRKRVYEKAGERALFNQIAIPVITALECFAFYMAPIMMLLAVLGGAGFAMIKKYMMLILFVNLWSFISIFVNLYTAISVENALGAASGFDPFSFDSLPDTILEVEGFLATAAALTASIPMLAMFLLYGGVHSMMGVMRNVASGSVDGNMGAPTISSSMKDGVQTMGDEGKIFGTSTGAYTTNHTLSSNLSVGSSSISDIQSSGRSASMQTVQSEVASSQGSYSQALSQAVVSGMGSASSVDKVNAQNWSEMNTDTKLSTLANTTRANESFSNEERAQMAIKAGAAAGLPVGKVSAGIDLNTAQLESTTYQEMVDKARGFQESGGTVTSNGNSSGSSEKTSDTKMFSDNEASQKAKTALEAYQLAEAKSMALGNSMSNIDSKTDTIQLDNATADKMFTWGHYDAWYDKLSASDKERLGSPTEYHDSSSAFKTARNIEETLKGGDKNLGLDAQDKGIAASLMRSIGNSIGDVDRATGFMVAANTYDKLANDVKQIDNANYGLSEDKSQQIQNNAQGAIVAAQSAELGDNTDNIALKNQKDAQGFVGPNAEQIQAQRDLMDNSISTGMLEKGQSLTAFLDKNHGWDDGNIPHSTNEHAVNNGTNLPSIYHGMDALINSDYKGMSSQDRTDALVAEKYLKDNPELYNGIGETQKDHMAKNMAYLAVNATDEERSHANGIYNGSQSRSDGIMGGVDDSFSAYAISDPYAKRVADQVTAINLANTDSTNPDLNYNGSANGGSLTDAANLAAILSNPSTTPEEAYDLGRGGDSPFAMLAGVLSLSSDNELALAGAKYGDVFSSAAQDPHTIANVEAMRQGTQDGNIISPDPVYSSVQDDGSLGQSFSAGGETYTLSNDGNANSNYNTYTDSQGISYTQPSGSDFIARTGTENSAYNTVADNNNEATTSFLSPIVGSTIASAAGHVVEDATNFAGGVFGSNSSNIGNASLGDYSANSSQTVPANYLGSNIDDFPRLDTGADGKIDIGNESFQQTNMYTNEEGETMGMGYTNSFTGEEYYLDQFSTMRKIF